MQKKEEGYSPSSSLYPGGELRLRVVVSDEVLAVLPDLNSHKWLGGIGKCCALPAALANGSDMFSTPRSQPTGVTRSPEVPRYQNRALKLNLPVGFLDRCI